MSDPKEAGAGVRKALSGNGPATSSPQREPVQPRASVSETQGRRSLSPRRWVTLDALHQDRCSFQLWDRFTAFRRLQSRPLENSRRPRTHARPARGGRSPGLRKRTTPLPEAHAQTAVRDSWPRPIHSSSSPPSIGQGTTFPPTTLPTSP